MKKFYTLLFSILTVSLFTLKTQAQSDTLILQPGSADGFDSEVRTDLPDQNKGDWFDFIANAWTAQGNFFVMRSFIKFDLTSIPSNATVSSATLDLYTNLNTGHYQLDSGPNTAYFMRVIEAWSEHLVTWNHQPAVTSDNLVVLPQSTSHTQTYHVDLTAHVQDMVLHPENNFGWMFRLETEDIYRCMVFCTSDHPNPSWRPRLTVIYTHCSPPTAGFYYNFSYPYVDFYDTTLSATAHAWFWDFGDGTTSTAQNPIHTYENTGIFNVCMRVTDSCSIDSVCHEVQFLLPLHVQFSSGLIVPWGLEVTFADKTDGATEWFWTFGDGATSILQNPVHTYKQGGGYRVCLRAGNGVSHATSCDSILLLTSPPETHFITAVYPNPPSDQKINIRFEEDAEYADISLYDFLGKNIEQQRIVQIKKSDRVSLNLPELQRGVYFIKIQFNSINKVFKLSLP